MAAMKHIGKATLCLITALAAPAAMAQAGPAFPSRPITIVAPYSPGATADTEGRIYANQLSINFRQPVLVDFKPGAGTTIGMTYVARSAPDGYTLLLGSSTYPLMPLVYRDLPYDPIKAFTPISLMSKRLALLVVNPSLPISNVAEYIAYAKAHPGEINFATSGSGGIQHLTGAWLNSITGTQTTFIHYGKGTGSLIGDLLGGRVHMLPMTFSTGLPLVKSGKLRALGVASLQRAPLLPDMPTLAEQGLRDFEYSSWLGILAPSRTPDGVIQTLAVELAKVARTPEVVQKLSGDGFLIGNSPEEFRRHIQVEGDRWRKLVQDAGIKFEE